MSQALTPPFLLGAVVLCLAGLAKLRSSDAAARAGREVGLPSDLFAVRLLALLEVAAGLAALLFPGRASAGAIAALFAFFAVISVKLVRRRAGCGCFGESGAPTSSVHVFLSCGFSLVALASLVFVPHGVPWLLARPVAQGLVLATAIAASAYGVVIAYTALPQAWSSWSGR